MSKDYLDILPMVTDIINNITKSKGWRLIDMHPQEELVMLDELNKAAGSVAPVVVHNALWSYCEYPHLNAMLIFASENATRSYAALVWITPTRKFD
jgi:hypothetical protein